MERRALIELLHGEGAHARSLSCVEGIPFALAARRVEGLSHTLWELVRHVNYWMEYEVERIRGRAPAYPEHASGSWPSSPPPDEASFEVEVERFRNLLQELETLARSSDEDLARPVPDPHGSHQGVASSLESVLWQTVVHNSYHIGQIVLLRKRLDIWPPEGGGDTW